MFEGLNTDANAFTAKQSVFGILADGREVPAVTLANQAGLRVTVIAYGATLQSVALLDAGGRPTELTLGFEDLQGHVLSSDYFGSTVGRYANRIANGQFVINGTSFQIPPNDGVNALHGGPIGFDKVLWDVVDLSIADDRAAVTLRYLSMDGDQGFPGNLEVSAIYSLDNANCLRIEYGASTDRPTPVNISNHAYWNLAGEGSSRSAMDHLLKIPADTYLPVGATLIPTGERRPVAGSAFDFRELRPIRDHIRSGDPQIGSGRGYDHNWIVADQVSDDLHFSAQLLDPHSRRSFELWSNQPGLQFYSGNFLDGTLRGRSGNYYRQGDAVVLEPQHFPDAMNRDDFPQAILMPGEEYRNIFEYKFLLDV